MSNLYRESNGSVSVLDSGTIRVHNDHSFDGSYIDTKDNRRKKYIGGTVHVYTDAGWVPDVATRIGDSGTSNGSAPQGSSIRRNYLDAIDQMRLKQLEPAQKATGVHVDAPASEALTPKQRYLRELDRQGRRG